MITTINDQKVTVFEITGNDVLTFLNNQVVTQLKQTTDSPILSAICNPKGRIIFTLILHSHPEVTYVAVDSSLSDNFLQYINMRRFRMDLHIKKSTALLAIDKQAPVTDSNHGFIFTQEADLPAVDANKFWLHMFKSGLPWITAQTTEKFIPQHLNLDQLGVIDFDKGCYPGQEIVARLHFLGTVKKRMQAIQYQAEKPYTANTEASIPEYEKPITFSAPAVMHQGKWHSQAIISTT